MADVQKRSTAYKMRIGDILQGKPVTNNDRFSHLELNGKNVLRVNVIANIVEKYNPEEKNFISFTIDDASGQIRLRAFGDDTKRFTNISQGDTVMIIGLLRMFNNELYIIPEIMKTKDPRYLLIRKLELDERAPAVSVSRDEILAIKDQIISKLKEADSQGGVDTESLVMALKFPPEAINSEIKKLLEGGEAYEPRPGKLRYLG
jgi:RPA family protein